MSNEHFNLIAGCYNRVAQFQLDSDILRHLDIPENGILMDAGGGTGRVAAELDKYFDITIVVDVAKKMLNHAKQKALTCLLAPIETLPIVGNSIDRIIMMDAFHHLRDQPAAARDLYRILKPGGRIIIIEPDFHQWRVKILALAEKILFMRSRFFLARTIESFFTSLGGEVHIHYKGVNVHLIIIKNDN